MSEQTKGSADSSAEPSFLTIGEITKPHGVRGDVRVIPHTDLPERFGWLERVFVGKKAMRLMTVEKAKLHKNMVLLKLGGINNRAAAESLRGEQLVIPEEEGLPLEEGEYYLFQLEGLTVVTDEGETLGSITQIIETGANNVLVVRGDAGDLLIPDTEEVVQEIDFENGRMLVHLLPGLLP